jgi:hypothetical protein
VNCKDTKFITIPAVFQKESLKKPQKKDHIPRFAGKGRQISHETAPQFFEAPFRNLEVRLLISEVGPLKNETQSVP